MTLRQALGGDARRIHELVDELLDGEDSLPHGSGRTLRQVLVSFAGAAGIALLVPFAVLVVGLPIALVVRGLLEVCVWLFTAIR